LGSPTRRGVYYDLYESPYIWFNGEYKLYFSSASKLRQYEKNLFSLGTEIENSINFRLKGLIDLDRLIPILVYNKIETKGFLVESKGVFYRWLNEIKVSIGELKTRKR